MKFAKKIIVLLMTALILTYSGIAVYAAAPEEDAQGQIGQLVTVEFSYESITGIDGIISYSNQHMFSDVKITTTGLTSGAYNPEDGKFSYFSTGKPVDCKIFLLLTVSSRATIGESCTITLKYETSDTNDLPAVPVYKTDTVTVTVIENIDYSKLAQLISIAELYDAKNYTATSWMFLELALENAKNNLTAQTQSEVDKAYNRLNTAIEALEINPVYDYKELEKQIIIAESLDESEYTASTWSTLEKALKNAKAAMTITNQSEIDEAAQNLENAIVALKKVSTGPVIDYSALKKQITIAGDLKKRDYTSDSWEELEDALYYANLALTSTNQTFVDDAALALRIAIANLVPVSNTTEVNYGELNRQIAIAEGLLKPEYTPETWAVLESALNNAKAARSSNDQKVVNNATAALTEAISNLEKQIYNIDYTELNKQITIAEGLVQKDYTLTTWLQMQKELSNAKNLITSIDQQEVDEAAQALKQAIAALVPMNYQALLEAMQSVKGHADTEELSKYWHEMHELLVKADELSESGDQAAVDACTKELQALLVKIIEHLAKLKEVETVVVEKPVPSEPTDDYCNIESHRVWPILFWISLAFNFGLVAFIVVYYIIVIIRHINKKRKNNDNTPLVDYDIGDDI